MIVVVQLAAEIPPGRHLLEGGPYRLHFVKQEQKQHQTACQAGPAVKSLDSRHHSQSGCQCLKQLVICQLKALFIGFHDYLLRFPNDAVPVEGSKRKRALFDSFMKMQETDFHKSRDVNYYAEKLNITPKYLNTISKSITGHNAKAIIDHYVILKLKLELSNSDCPIKQLAWNYNFSDVSFFTRYFRLHTGTTPIAYRKSSAQSAQLGIVGE